MRKIICTHAATLDLAIGVAVIGLVGYTLTSFGTPTSVALGLCAFPIVFIVFYSGPVIFQRITRQLIEIGDKIEIHAKAEKGTFRPIQGTVLNKGIQTIPEHYADEYIDADKAKDFCVELATEEGQTIVPVKYLVKLI